MDRRSVLGRLLAATAAAGWVGAGLAQGGSAVWVAVASSAQRAMDEVVPAWSQATGYRWSMSYGAPGRLVQQISEGLPAQLFLAADEGHVAQLQQAGLAADPGEVYAVGRLALAVAPGAPWTPDARLLALRAAWPELTRFALPHPELEPYGQAGRAVLERLGLWQQALPRLVWAESAAQAAQLVADGNAQAGFTALALLPGTARSLPHVAVDDSLHPPLRQRMVLLKGAGPAARSLYRHLLSQHAQEVLRRHGFSAP